MELELNGVDQNHLQEILGHYLLNAEGENPGYYTMSTIKWATKLQERLRGPEGHQVDS